MTSQKPPKFLSGLTCPKEALVSCVNFLNPLYYYSAVLKKVEKIFNKKEQSLNLPLCVIIGCLIAIFVKSFLLDFYTVQGHSMEPAIKDQKVIAVNKIAYGLQNPFKPELLFNWKEPAKGDIILYMYQNYWVVKRCAATAGTPLDFLEENGQYFLLFDQSKIPLSSIQFHKMRSGKKVPDGYILAIGDNHSLSHDSRDYGFVPQKNIVAKAIGKR